MEYSNFNISISRKQAQNMAFAIIADIEDYVEKHCAEYEEFLKAEALRERGEDKML